MQIKELSLYIPPYMNKDSVWTKDQTVEGKTFRLLTYFKFLCGGEDN